MTVGMNMNVLQFCIHSTVGGNFSGLCYRTIRNDTTMNILVRLLMHVVCIAIGYISKSRITETQGIHMLRFNRYCQTVLQGGYTDLFSCQQQMKIPDKIYFCHHLIFQVSLFFNFSYANRSVVVFLCGFNFYFHDYQ